MHCPSSNRPANECAVLPAIVASADAYVQSDLAQHELRYRRHSEQRLRSPRSTGVPQVRRQRRDRDDHEGDVQGLHADEQRLGLRAAHRCGHQWSETGLNYANRPAVGRRDRLRGQHHREHLDERRRDFGRQDERHVQLRDERDVGEPEEVRQPGVWRQRPAARARDIGSGQPTGDRVGGDASTPQTAAVNAAYATNLAAKVVDACGPAGRRRDRDLRGAGERASGSFGSSGASATASRGRRRRDGTAFTANGTRGSVQRDGQRRRCVDPRHVSA